MKTCFKCKQEKSLADFGRNKYFQTHGARDGRAVYCKLCCRATMAQLRAEIRARELARKPNQPAKQKPTVSDKVFTAILFGRHTWPEIQEFTKLGEDTIGDALAKLAFDESVIRIVRVGETREFHLAA